VRAPLLIRWPGGIPARGEKRRQFYHVVDVTPTILAVLGLDLPERVGGIEQIPLHGVSMAHTFVDDDAETHKETQYFETIGQRGIWHKGWKAVTFHRGRTDYDSDPWELYNLDQDIAELNDLSSEYPQRLDELISLWWQEAERYGVLALDDLAGRSGMGWEPEDRSRWVLYQDAVLPHFYRPGPRVFGLSHRITARVERESTRKSGVIIADGGRFGGWCIYIYGNRLHYTLNVFGKRCRVPSPLALPSGPVTLRADVVRTGKTEGVVRFFVNGEPAGDGRLNPFRYWGFFNEPLTVGFDSQTPVDDFYGSPFTFDGRIIDVVIETVGKEVVDEGVLLDQLMGSQ
jgi:arylsulfatase